MAPILHKQKIKTAAMPELPDIEVFTYNLQQQYAGKKLKKIKVVTGKKLVDNETTLNKAVAGSTLQQVYKKDVLYG
jgi:formamidopyrimidine-DNA glycosylase